MYSGHVAVAGIRDIVARLLVIDRLDSTHKRSVIDLKSRRFTHHLCLPIIPTQNMDHIRSAYS